MTVQEFLTNKGYNVAKDDTLEAIEMWEDWYKNEVDNFHHYMVYNGVETVEVDRYAMGMAKTVSENWANMLLNERVNIHTETDFDDDLTSAFKANNFYVKGNQLIEIAFALGTGAFVEYKGADGQPVIDYINAEKIYPINWENGYINECAFGSTREVAGKRQLYIQVHELEKGKYVIKNFVADEETGEELELPEDMLDEVLTGSKKPLFQIITPNIVNTIDFGSPFGMSVFGNAISQVKGCDIVYDSFMNEFEMGRKRIMVPMSMAQVKMQGDGTVKPVFNKHDTVFYAIPENDGSNNKIECTDMAIRSADHEIGINNALNVLSLKCGLGTNHFRFEAGTVKTATEVISADSELYRTLQKHELVIESALIGLVEAIAFLLGKQVKPENIKIEFDDSIIQDKESERATDKGEVAMGAMSLIEYRSKWYGETEEEAASRIPEQADVMI